MRRDLPLSPRVWLLRPLTLAVLCLPAVGSAADNSLGALLDQLEHPREAGSRIRAAEAIAQYGERAVSPLRERLHHREILVRLYAGVALVRLGPRAGTAVPDLIAIVGDTGESEHVRETAIVALGQIGPMASPAVPVLRAALGENRFEFRRSVLSALAGIATPEAVGALVELLEHGQPEEQRAVLAALWAQGVKAKSAAAELLAVAARQPDGELSDRIFLTVATFGPDAAAELAPYLQADRLDTRRRAILALSRLGPDAVVTAPGLTELLKDESVLVRFWATKALGNIGPKARQATASLLQLLEDGDPNVRWEATTAIAKIDPAAFTEVHWSRLLADSDPGVRQRAATIRFASL